MHFYSTNNKEYKVDLRTAVMQSLAPDKGLYMPSILPILPKEFFSSLQSYTFHEICCEISYHLLGHWINKSDIDNIIHDAYDFGAQIHSLSPTIHALELWHGPSLAFKDFGARFMAKLMGHFIKNSNKKHTILVATSGDTGGAVASGFFNTPGIDVIILYPKGKVSPLQEKQLTTFGGNIQALEIEGSFDDCQSLVKFAFLDQDINKKYTLSSANSINIARLIPQSFYYFDMFRQIKTLGIDGDIVVSVPSGNFGNLTAGLMAKKMGLPIKKFIAATNVNHVVPTYLETGDFHPTASMPTISNAMDVGNPSNFVRILNLYQQDIQSIRKDVQGFWLDDDDTKQAMQHAYENYQYICDPHGAIGYKSLDLLENHEVGVFLETAHPSKFIETCQSTLQIDIPIPERLAVLSSKEKQATTLENDTTTFKSYLMDKVG